MNGAERRPLKTRRDTQTPEHKHTSGDGFGVMTDAPPPPTDTQLECVPTHTHRFCPHTLGLPTLCKSLATDAINLGEITLWQGETFIPFSPGEGG